jgi:hypothetical protein
MASDTMDSQATTNQGRSGLAFGLRALIAMTLASALLAGCSTPVERQTTATGLPGAGDAQAMVDQTRRSATDTPEADPIISGDYYRADTFRCISRPADCRVRDLRTPWEARRYLMPDGTLSDPPSSEAPR